MGNAEYMGNEHQTIHYNSSDINSAMPSETPLPIRLAQTLGITSSLILSGMTLSTSLTTVPRLLESPPTLLLQQWGHMYDRGRKTGPPIASSPARHSSTSPTKHTSPPSPPSPSPLPPPPRPPRTSSPVCSVYLLYHLHSPS